MNTKTDGISSGLVAVAWLAPSNYEWPSHFFSMTEIRNGEPLVRLSDAEAKLSECVTSYEKEVAGLTAELDAKDVEIERLALYKNLADEYGLSVFADLKEQASALKLASLALSEGVEYVEEPPEKYCTCHLSPPCNDCVDHSAVREFFIDARKALAAIDALGE